MLRKPYGHENYISTNLMIKENFEKKKNIFLTFIFFIMIKLLIKLN